MQTELCLYVQPSVMSVLKAASDGIIKAGIKEEGFSLD